MGYEFQFNVIWQNWDLFLFGAWLTVQIASVSTGLGLIIGMVMAGLQLSLIHISEPTRPY